MSKCLYEQIHPNFQLIKLEGGSILPYRHGLFSSQFFAWDVKFRPFKKPPSLLASDDMNKIDHKPILFKILALKTMINISEWKSAY